jgi:hypothetical protein
MDRAALEAIRERLAKEVGRFQRFDPEFKPKLGSQCGDGLALLSHIDALREALEELADYTEAVLTGPIMEAAGVQWPNGKPQAPSLLNARRALGDQP